VNADRRPERVPEPAGVDVLRFHEALPGYRPTPLHTLQVAGADVHVKDESDRFGLPAFKILGASWAVERALAADPATTMLVAASAGNHGRAVARAAAQRGVACRILLPRAVSRARADLIIGEGAQVTRVDGDYDAAVAAAGRAAGEVGVAVISDTGTAPSASWVVEGYTTLFREAAAQAAGPFGVVIVPIGVGSPRRLGGPRRIPPAAARGGHRGGAGRCRVCHGVAGGRPSRDRRDAGHGTRGHGLRHTVRRRVAGPSGRPDRHDHRARQRDARGDAGPSPPRHRRRRLRRCDARSPARPE
jgi:hypothetical protein